MVLKRECGANGGRSLTIDFLKAIAIILVVVGHCIQYGFGHDYIAGKAYFDNTLFKVIYSFHMPLFMLISGYLFAFSVEKGTWKTTVTKKVKSILIPLLIWSLLLFVIKIISGEVSMTVIGLAKGYLSTSIVSL